MLKIHPGKEIKALTYRQEMIKVESQWLSFNSVLFSLALMGICCKNSSWCNGTAYAKISHKPLQFTLRSFSFSLGMFQPFLLTLMHSLCCTHDNHNAVSHHALSPSSFSCLQIPSCLFLEKKNIELHLKHFQVKLEVYSFPYWDSKASPLPPPCLSWTSSHCNTCHSS